MYAMSLTRLYMHVVPVLDIRVMLLMYPPSLNHIFKSDWPWMHEHQVMTQQCTSLYDMITTHLYITHLCMTHPYINTSLYHASTNNTSLYNTSLNHTSLNNTSLYHTSLNNTIVKYTSLKSTSVIHR